MNITFKLLLLCSFAFAGLHAEKKQVSFRGNAYDAKSGKFLYSENHTEYYRDGKHHHSVVLYRARGGKILVRKYITFAYSKTKPSYTLKDKRDGYLERVRNKGKVLQVQFQKNRKQSLKSENIKNTWDTVVDGGFDYYIRQNWDKIVKSPRKFLFVAPSQQDSFRFRISYVKRLKYKGSDCAKFEMVLSNAMLRLLVKPITLYYTVSDRRLKGYRGISNINDSKGKSYFVNIVFSYPKS
ncbi:MAG: hypothetical protein AAF518_29105 [Spirochaetota bacterium]